MIKAGLLPAFLLNMQKKTLLFTLLPIAAGIIVGVGVLFFNPDAGKNLGSFLYSSSKDPQSYAYARSQSSSRRC